MFGIWGWFNNWPFIGLLKAPLALLLSAGFVIGVLFWIFFLYTYLPWVGIFFIICVAVGFVIALSEMILFAHRLEDTEVTVEEHRTRRYRS